MTDQTPPVHLPDWFWRLSPLSMDALTGPDEQYRAGARDMLAVVEHEFTLIPRRLGKGRA